MVVNLPFAKHCIDTLDILADKTKGNLTTGEDSLLSRFLYELRMLYVAVQNQLKKQDTAAHEELSAPDRDAVIGKRTRPEKHA